MIKKISVFFILLFTLFVNFQTIVAQANVWVWMKGATNGNAAPVYGTQGIPAAANTPGGRYEANEWRDLNGNLWLFGGTSNSGSNRNNDMWKYDPTTNMWTWMRGSNTSGSAGSYGTMGVASPTNDPPARATSLTWTDNNGFLWLYGGFPQTGQTYNDLWKYNTTTNEWTWVMGNPPSGLNAVFGTMGVPAAANHPGKRNESSCTWVDNNNNLWLFGGDQGSNNSVWKYNITTNEWTWMHGPTSTQAGIYGTMGVAAAANRPGGRWAFSSWKDIQGNFWLFGGYGKDKNNTNGSLNDLWMFSPGTNMWTWMNGSDLVNDTGSYGTKCIYATTNEPPARMENRARWTDECGNFWMFGGRGNFGVLNSHNDLWRYVSNPGSPNVGNWVWVSGTNLLGQASIFGTQGVISPLNMPGERQGAVSWYEKKSLWLFGGYATPSGGSQFNDLWRYFPDTIIASFTASASSGCAPLTVNFTNQSTTGCNEIKSYSWDFGDPAAGSNNTSTNSSPSYTYTTTGNYNVKMVVSNCTGDKDSSTFTINVTTLPTATISADTSVCSGSLVSLTASGAASYQWYPATGLSATTGSSVNLIPTTGNTYTVIASNGAGCNDTASVSITTIPAPSVTIAGITSICSGDSTSLSASGAINYQWNPSTGISSNTSSIVLYNGTSTTTYTLTGTNSNGCSDTATITVSVNNIPTALVGPDDTICYGESATIIASGGSSYSWTTTQTTASITVTPPLTTSYSATVSNGPCYDIASATITVIPLPTVTAAGSTTIIIGSSAILSASGTGTFSWSPSNGLSCVSCPNPVVSPTTTTTYYVTTTDAYGCTDIDTVTIVVDIDCNEIKVPNAFSPNGDGQNDILYVYGQNCIRVFTFSVFNRWGEKVFETSDISKGWDGTYHGKQMDAAVFTFLLKAQTIKNEDVILEGNITLIR